VCTGTERKEIDDILRDPLKEVLSLPSAGNLLHGMKSEKRETQSQVSDE
jgi:hypothetical protein